MTTLTTTGSRGFFGFYREYAQTGIHAATAVGVTIFGVLASLFWEGFVLLAIAVYLFPLTYLYMSDDQSDAPDSREPNVAQPDVGEPTIDEPDPSDPEPNATSTPGSEAATRSHSRAETAVESTDGSDSDDGSDTDASPAWVAVDSPTDEPLSDAIVAQEAVVAVGDDGVVLARHDGDWEVALEHGPAAESNPLWGVDASDDGERVWFCGDSGVLGRYEPGNGRLVDRSAPLNRTDTWKDVAVVGPAGDERIHLVNGSGEVISGRVGGDGIDWSEPTKPGSGSSLSAISFLDRETGYCCDTSQGVFETANDGHAWERIGIDDAGVDFNDLAVTREGIVVAGGDGSVFRYDDPGWTKLRVGEEALFAVDWTITSDEGGGDERGTGSGLVVGDGGTIHELVGHDWEPVDSRTGETLCGVVVGDRPTGADGARPDVAVGENGTILERAD